MPIDGYLLQKAAVEVFIMDICFHFSWKTPKREMVESCRGYMFNILRNCQTLFKVVAPFKIPTSHVRHFQFLSYYCLYLVSPDFFYCILIGVKQYLIMVSTFIFLIWCPLTIDLKEVFHESFQAGILEWVTILFSRGSSRLRDWT